MREVKSSLKVNRGSSGAREWVPSEFVTSQLLDVSVTRGISSVTVNERVILASSRVTRGDSVMAVTTGVAVGVRYATHCG